MVRIHAGEPTFGFSYLQEILRDFCWQSQSTTGEDSPTGRRYVCQKENGTRFLLFVRPKRGDPFVFLGPLHYVSHNGSRPMSIYWDLEHPMPAWFFEICATPGGLSRICPILAPTCAPLGTDWYGQEQCSTGVVFTATVRLDSTGD